jgi:hypothetical protein
MTEVDLQVALRHMNAQDFRAHALHDAMRDWPETNCYVDLWIEILHGLKEEPEAALGFTLQQDFEGDHFTFFKFPPEDLADLFGLRVQELAIFDRLEGHVLEQTARGHLVLVEVDAFHLPDTRGVSYGTEHSKTTVAILRLDPHSKQMDYFHNAGFFSLQGGDYNGIFAVDVDTPGLPLSPYVEFVKRGRRPPDSERLPLARTLFARHLALAPAQNPVRAFARRIDEQARGVADREPLFFHKYAFNTLRQLGANFELLSAHLGWLTHQGEAGLGQAAIAAKAISSGAKSFQFLLARAVTRRRFDDLGRSLDPIAQAWDDCLGSLRHERG